MFSVIVPAYNSAHCIGRAIDSILAQTVPDFEIIVVDDGSTDETVSVVNEKTDARIRLISQPNGGVSAARNMGIQAAQGEYLCFLDADDFWHANHLETVSRLISEYPCCNLYLTGYEILLNNGKTIAKGAKISAPIQSDNVYQNILDWGYFFNTNSIVCEKSTIDHVGLFEVGVKNSEDDDLWYRLFAHYSAAITPEVTTTYVRENSTATAQKVFVFDWRFLERVPHLLQCESIPNARKAALVRLIEQRKLSSVRHRILSGEKCAAWKEFRALNVKLLKKKKYWNTVGAFLIPQKVVQAVIRRRDRNYYQQ